MEVKMNLTAEEREEFRELYGDIDQLSPDQLVRFAILRRQSSEGRGEHVDNLCGCTSDQLKELLEAGATPIQLKKA